MKSRAALAVVPFVLLATVAAAGVVWKIGTSSDAVGSTPAGTIAFSGPSDAGAFPFPPSDLFVIEADGSERRPVATCEGRSDIPSPSPRSGIFGCILRAFSWSPDGQRLAYVQGSMGGRDKGPDLWLFVVDADGKNERRVSGCGKPKWPSCGDFFGSQLAWEPGGSRLVVPRDGALYLFDVDRSGYRRLTPDCGPRRCFVCRLARQPPCSSL